MTTILTAVDDDLDDAIRAYGDDISMLLDGHDVEHDVHPQHDGDEGWHLLITAGHAIHGSPLREYTITYITAERRWIWQAESEDGEQDGPHGLPELTAGASPVEVADHIAARIKGGG